jgi:hypothetical protein
MTLINNKPITRRVCEGSEGSEGNRRCVIPNNLDLYKKNKHNFIDNTHIEIPSQPSHPHICAQLSVRVNSVPSQPSQSLIINNNEIESSLDFILSHFEEPFLFPRKISTYKSQQNRPFQFSVRSRQEIIDSFIDSDFVDCQINSYSCLIEYKDVPRYKPDFLFIDRDRNDPRFKTDRSFELALYNTLKNIKEKLEGAYPTVLFTGGGYHIYQPVYIPTALENITEFNGFDRPSELFLRFSKDYLSLGKADRQSKPSFKSCLLRIPGSYRSKYNKPVKIIKKWNAYRPNITRDFIEEFRTWLIQKKIDQEKQRQKISIERSKNKFVGSCNYYSWIEHLLNTSIEDYRKLVVDIILAPYLINVRQLSYEESYRIIKDWLDKCNDIKRLDNYRNFEYRISYALKTANKKQIPPMSYNTLKENYNDLYSIIIIKQKDL